MKSETMAQEQEEGKASQNDLTKITGIGPAMADKLFSKGIKSIAMVAATEPELLSQIPGIGEKTAQQWIETAGKILNEEIAGNKSDSSSHESPKDKHYGFQMKRLAK